MISEKLIREVEKKRKKRMSKSHKEIKFQGIIELDADNNHIEHHLICEIMNRLQNIGIYTLQGAIRTKGLVKLTSKAG